MTSVNSGVVSGSRSRRPQENRCRVLMASFMASMIGVAGCGMGESGPPRYRVFGRITYDGQPVPFGGIQFLPDSSKGNEGPAGYATIVNGEFDTDKNGKGMIGGPHQVLITGMKSAPSTESHDPDKPAENNELFPQYSTTEDFPKGEANLNLAVGKIAK